MSRVEWIGAATLILGDCRDVLAGLHADVLLTDPVWPNVPAESVPGWDRPWELWAEACALLPALQRAVVVMRCDSDPRFLASLPAMPFFRCIQLPYVIPGYIGRALGGDEIAYWFGSPIASAPNRRLVPSRGPSVQPSGRRANGHPMSRAQPHFDWLAGWCTDPGEVLLDPFMGSGTSLIGALRHGRACIGIEVHEPFFDIACRRVEQALRQTDMLLDAT